MMRALHWEKAADGSVACGLCPRACVIREGGSGACRVRRNSGGAMALPYAGLVSSMAVDPIEKKPLYHFLPGTSVFSMGFYGCNLHCPFCQNWTISQAFDPEGERLDPETAVAEAVRSGCPSIAYTYSEPLVHFEYVMECARIARRRGLKNVLVTNGCINPGPARELLPLVDAVNVDIKTWSPETYSRVLGGDRDAVLEFARIAAECCHVEATTLVVTGCNDTAAEIEAIAGWIADISKSIVLHLSAYRPMYRYREPPTDPELLADFARIARKRLDHVYLGNVVTDDDDTRCVGCGKPLIERRGYRVSLTPSKDGVCPFCGTRLPYLER